MDLAAILDAFEDALMLERELGTRLVECDRTLLAPVARPQPAVAIKPSSPTPVPPPPPIPAAAPGKEAQLPDFAFLLECEPSGQVAELLPKMSEAIGYGPDGVKINDPKAKVLIVMGLAAMQKWLPGVKAIPGQWVKRGETPVLVTVSPTKTYRFFADDAAKIHALKLRLWQDLKTALARLGKTPPPVKRAAT